MKGPGAIDVKSMQFSFRLICHLICDSNKQQWVSPFRLKIFCESNFTHGDRVKHP